MSRNDRFSFPNRNLAEEQIIRASEYVIGELSPREREVFEAEMADDPRLAQEVAAWTDVLAGGLAPGNWRQAMPVPLGAEETLRAALDNHPQNTAPAPLSVTAINDQVAAAQRSWWQRFDHLLTLVTGFVGGGVAAGLALFFVLANNPSSLLERAAPEWASSAVLYNESGDAAVLVRIDGDRIVAEPLALASAEADSERYNLWAIGATETPLLIGSVSAKRRFQSVGTAVQSEASIIYAMSRDPAAADLSDGPVGPVVLTSRDLSL